MLVRHTDYEYIAVLGEMSDRFETVGNAIR